MEPSLFGIPKYTEYISGIQEYLVLLNLLIPRYPESKSSKIFLPLHTLILLPTVNWGGKSHLTPLSKNILQLNK